MTPPFPARDRFYVQGVFSSNGFASITPTNGVPLINNQAAQLFMPLGAIVTSAGTVAFGSQGLTVAKAQLAVSGETGRYPEFAGNVKCIDARPFWRDKSVSPSGQGYHYNHNAETYMEVGSALGWAMAELLAAKPQ